MAYFECTIGGGMSATIIVTYDASLYDKTITCSNGIDTYTQTTTSSGVTEFEVDTEGTWTITCNSVSKTVDVVFNYDVTLTITKNITVYSAANDTLSFTDVSGSKTVTTDSSGAGSVSISFAIGDIITFTSSVAKNPNNASEYYSKTIEVTDSTTDVYVMPDVDGVIYWYGFKNSTYTHGQYGNIAEGSFTSSEQTNTITFQYSNGYGAVNFGKVIDFEKYNKANYIANVYMKTSHNDAGHQYVSSQYAYIFANNAATGTVIADKLLAQREPYSTTEQTKDVNVVDAPVVVRSGQSLASANYASLGFQAQVNSSAISRAIISALWFSE